MRLENIHIEGFGIHCNYHLDSLPNGITVLLGPNESGKTTLLEFIRSVLFGFKDGRTKGNDYQPVNGGKRGGRISLINRRGERFVIERYAGPKGGESTLTLPDGSTGSPEDLHHVLCSLSRDTFENIFAFGMDELRDFDSLHDKTVLGRIYSAGVGLVKRSLPEIEKDLEEENAKLYKSRRSASEINRIIAELNEVQDKLHLHEGSTERYSALTEEILQLKSDILRKEEELKSGQRRLVHVQNLGKAWEDWSELVGTKRGLESFPVITVFPEDAVGKYDRLNTKLENVHERLKEKNDELKRLKTELEALSVNQKILKEAKEIERLYSGKDKYFSALTDLPEREQELRNEQVLIDQGIKDLGTGWNEDRISAFDTSIPVHEEVRKFRDGIESVNREISDVEKECTKIKEELLRSGKDRDTLALKVKSLEIPAAQIKALDERSASVRKIRSLLPCYLEKKRELERMADKVKVLSDQNDFMGLQQKQLPQPASKWLSILLISLGVVAGIGFGLTGNFSISLTSLFILSILGIGHLFFSRNQTKRYSGLQASLQNKTVNLKNEIQNLEQEQERLGQELNFDGEEIRKLAKILGKDSLPRLEEIESIMQELEAENEAIRKFASAQEASASANENHEVKEDDFKKKEQSLSKKIEEKEAQIAAWGQWLKGVGLPAALTSDGVLQMFSLVSSLREKLVHATQLKERIEKIRGIITTYEMHTVRILKVCGYERTEGEPASIEADRLMDELKKSRSAQERASHIEFEMKSMQDQTASLTAEIEKVGKALKEILKSCGAVNEPEMREKEKYFQQRKSLEVKISQCQANIQKLCGHGESYEKFTAELAAANPEELSSEEANLKGQNENLSKAIGTSWQYLGEKKKEVEGLENEEEVSDLRMRESILMERFRSIANEWAVRQISLSLIRRAREKYERERQPALVKEAGNFFGTITAGRYKSIFAPLVSDGSIEVIDCNDKRKKIHILSRGTAEPLYLSLRFGLVREFAQHSEPFFVIMDDILVSCDPERAKNAVKALGELAKDHQILFFTCHPSSVEFFKENNVPVRLINESEMPAPVSKSKPVPV